MKFTQDMAQGGHGRLDLEQRRIPADAAPARACRRGSLRDRPVGQAGALRVRLPDASVRHALAPALAAFAERHPDLAMQLDSPGGADAAPQPPISRSVWNRRRTRHGWRTGWAPCAPACTRRPVIWRDGPRPSIPPTWRCTTASACTSARIVPMTHDPPAGACGAAPSASWSWRASAMASTRPPWRCNWPPAASASPRCTRWARPSGGARGWCRCCRDGNWSRSPYTP